MKERRNSSQQRFRNGAERHANRFATSASRSNSRYSLSETHATPDGHAVKQIGEHAWLIEKAESWSTNAHAIRLPETAFLH